jgi:hypothetical protein
MDLLCKRDRAKLVDHWVSLLGERDRLPSLLNAQPAVIAEPRTAAYKAGPKARNVKAQRPTGTAEPWAAAFIAGLQAENV